MNGVGKILLLWLSTLLTVSVVYAGSLVLKENEFAPPPELLQKHFDTKNDAVIGIVEKLFGVAYVSHASKTSRSELSVGHRVFEGDTLYTTKSRLHVRFKDGTYVELGEDTAFNVERLRFKPAEPLGQTRQGHYYDETTFRINNGIVRVSAPEVHALERFTIKTVNSIMKILEPVDLYLIQMPRQRDLIAKVVEGSIEIMSIISNEMLTVKQGSSVTLKISGSIHIDDRVTDDQISYLKSRTRI